MRSTFTALAILLLSPHSSSSYKVPLPTPFSHNFTPSSSPSSHARQLGLVPPAGFVDKEVQIDVAWKRVKTLINTLPLPPQSDADLTLAIYSHLQTLAYTSPSTFYALLLQNLPELMPYVYTPVVGAACVSWYEVCGGSGVNSGIWVDGFSADKDSIVKQLQQHKESKGDVEAIVVTDGERILGLGDLGANGMGIPVGKLHLYTACGGIDPGKCLPVTLDCGCNVDEIRDKPTYAGAKRKRELTTEQFDELVEAFMTAAMEVFGRNVLIQFEDFGNSNAFRVLDNWKDKATCFNDDIQGTASVVLAGLIASLNLTPDVKSLKDHKFLFLGAGEAGVGIANLIAYAIRAETGCSEVESFRNIHLVDSKGLVTFNRASTLQHHKLPFAHATSPADTLEEAVRMIKPTALIGVSAQPSTFTRDVIECMTQSTPNPLIFALSNPTSKAECTAEQAYQWSNGKCVFASGSPFAPVKLKNGETRVPGQGNNAYVFPGIGLGALVAGSTKVSDNDMYIAAKALASSVKQDRLNQGCLYPPLDDIREVSKVIAANIARKAWQSGTATVPEPADVDKAVEERMWAPFEEAN